VVAKLLLALAMTAVVGLPRVFAQTANTQQLSFNQPSGDYLGCPLVESVPTPNAVSPTVPKQIIEQAKVKERLRELLLDSLRADSEGRLDVRIEREIKKLAKKLR